MSKVNLLTIVLISCILSLGCSKSDSDNGASTVFLRMTDSNFIDDELVGTKIRTFENNKLITQDAFDPDGSLTSRFTYDYYSDGLLRELISFDANDNINFANKIQYENGNITLIERIRNTAVPPDTIYNIMTYASDIIVVESVNTRGQRLNLVQFYLNEDQLINSQVAGSTSIAVEMDEGLPISKTFTSPSTNVSFAHEYLDMPLPQAPWDTYWENIFGNFNNQILNRSLTGLSDFEPNVDLQKYLTSAGSSLRINYEFNDQDLPVRIEKTFSPSLKTIVDIEYQN